MLTHRKATELRGEDRCTRDEADEGADTEFKRDERKCCTKRDFAGNRDCCRNGWIHRKTERGDKQPFDSHRDRG